jgi:hypothetical protein
MPGKPTLFALTHWLLNAAAIFCMAIAAILAIALGALAVAASDLTADHLGIPALMPAPAHDVSRMEVLPIGGTALLGGLLSLLLILFALRAAAGIVQSAIKGDPFVNANATRLTRIGWFLTLLIGVQFATKLAVDGMAGRLAAVHHLSLEQLNVHFSGGSDISPVGILAVLLIFVLAQIFRHGSVMRDELQGTV